MTQLTPKYDTVIFDLDGTLLYTLTDLTTAVNAAMHRFGWQERTFEEMRHFVGNGIRNLMDHAVPGGEKNPLFEEAFA
ncbi:MAG: HAD hydrolase-like protein, partial [Acutalibacteraceae bacterium]|nr:HAD hydrolase-like protein [Acutalibacteraceae bacterium]